MLKLTVTPKDYQEVFFGHAVKQLDNDDTPVATLYSSPTGSGKSIMELMLLTFDEQSMLITPRLEIISDMLNKGGIDTNSMSDSQLADVAFQHRVTTPIRLRNMLAEGGMRWRPQRLIIDECHHAIADTYQDIYAYLGNPKRVGLTATPYRGTPKSTKKFLEEWGGIVNQILDIPSAAKRGIISIPNCHIWPLVDDDTISVSNGEFAVEAASQANRSRFQDLIERIAGGEFISTEGWKRPTLFAVPSTSNVYDLVEMLNQNRMPAIGITQASTRQERRQAFEAVRNCTHAIVQISVVSEGVDLPIRCIFDLRPTMSPVWWMQMIGRSTRPTTVPPEYYCCNRNLIRHGYLFEGMIPASQFAAAQAQFPLTERSTSSRAIGEEALGRFTPVYFPLSDGTQGVLYSISAVEGYRTTRYAVIMHPRYSEPLYAMAEHTKGATGQIVYGRWKRIDSLPEVKGYASTQPSSITEKQANWWVNAAKRYGLDPQAKVNKKNFQVLPVISDCGRPKSWLYG